MVVNCDDIEIIYFYHPDYLGSVEFITDMRGEPYQFFLNTPWGDQAFKKSLVGFFSVGASLPRGPENQYAKSYTSFSSRFRFNGKEWEGQALRNKPVAYFSEGASLPRWQWDEETGNYYYGARYYDPKVSVWLSVDPLAHEYPSLSSYVFTGNNPVMLVDPDGRHIDPAVQSDWDQHKINVTREFQNVVGQFAQAVGDMMAGKGTGANLGELGERASRLQGTLNTMTVAENSSQLYSLDNNASASGLTYYDPGSGAVVVSTDGSTSNFVHEVTHVEQFENSELMFATDGSRNAHAHDLYDEVAAYKNQFAYDPVSVMQIKSSSTAGSFGGITTGWVQNISTSSGARPYSNHGLVPVNINSSIPVLQKAYPSISSSLGSMASGWTLKNLPNFIYK